MKLKYKFFNWITDKKIEIKDEERNIDYSQVISVLEKAGYLVTKK